MTTGIRYAVGQQVWWARCQSGERFETCPDCGGTGRLRITFHDETQASIECRNCASGYDAPTGNVKWYGCIAEARQITITGFEFEGGKASYHSYIGPGSYYRIEECDIFVTEEEAKASAATMECAHNAKEQARILTKEKDTRTWAWNASYHRNCIKRAQRDIEYHTAKLNVASLKAKELKAGVAA